jgi:N-acylneuraminate cytidylyltransferase
MKKQKIFFIIKEKSQRLKNKNFLIINGLPLYKFVLYKLKSFKVFVDTDSDKIYSNCKKDPKLKHVICYKRKKIFIKMEKSKKSSPTPLMIKNYIENHAKKDKFIITSHITSPFLKISTLKNAIRKMKNFDSVSSCSKIQNFSYLEDKKVKPLNFNPKIIQKTQELKKIIHLNGAFFIFKRDIFLKNGLQRITKKNYFYELGFPELIDVDNYEDFELSKKIANKKLYK